MADRRRYSSRFLRWGGWLALGLWCVLEASGCSVEFADPPSQCGDGVVEGLEECDTEGVACSELGLEGPVAPCGEDCRLDTSLCWSCGDGTCSRQAGETGAVCPEDCVDLAVVAAGGGHTCAADTSGAVWCWGGNWSGQLGFGAEGTSTWPCPVRVEGAPAGVRRVWAGLGDSCVATDAGALVCWGDSEYGQCGTLSVEVSGPVQMLDGGVEGACVGDYHVCAVVRGRGVRCWGRNTVGQLGVPPDGDMPDPVLVPGLVDARGVTCGSVHTCAVTSSSSVWCWGGNYYGQLGDGTNESRSSPVHVLEGSVGVAAGAYHTCSWDADGAVWCWGANEAGQLGDGTQSDSAVPVRVPLPIAVVQVSCGDGFCCAQSDEGQVVCWGDNSRGQLGIGAGARQDPMDPVPALTDVRLVDCGAAHCCAVDADGGLWCWGANESGQVGDGTDETRYLPVRVELSGGERGYCARP